MLSFFSLCYCIGSNVNEVARKTEIVGSGLTKSSKLRNKKEEIEEKNGKLSAFKRL